MTPKAQFASSRSWVIAHFLHSQDVGGTFGRPAAYYLAQQTSIIGPITNLRHRSGLRGRDPGSEKKLATALARY